MGIHTRYVKIRARLRHVAAIGMRDTRTYSKNDLSCSGTVRLSYVSVWLACIRVMLQQQPGHFFRRRGVKISNISEPKLLSH